MKGKMTRRIMALGMAAVMAASMSTTAFAKTFDDYKSGWAFEAIDYVSDMGYMSGVGNNHFSANTAVTRAQMAQVMWNMEGKNDPESTNHFADVDKGAWYSKAVNWCSENGIVSGVGNSKYNPNGAVSREQLMTMVYRYLDKKGIDVESQVVSEAEMKKKFPGYGTNADKVSDWAKTYVQWAYGSGFSSGSGTKMNATETVTREQLAQFLMNLDLKMLGKDPDIKPDQPSVEQCEHGNDPDTCPICHPSEPTYEGSYREEVPFEETTTVAGLTGEQGAFLPQSDDPSGNAMFQKNNVSKCTQANADATRRNLDNAINSGDSRYLAYYNSQASIIPEGHSYKNFVPYGGTVVGGSTYTVDIGGHTYTKATEGSTIYNRFGVDVTSVDGVMTDTERKMMVMLQDISYYKKTGSAAKFGDDPTLVYDPCLQMVAEAALQEAKENADNLAKAGLNPAQCYGSRVTSSRNAVEASKKYDLSKSKLAHALFPNSTEAFGSTQMVMSCDEFLSSDTYKYYTQVGIADLPEEAIRMMWGDDYDPEYNHNSKECKNSSIDYNTSSDLYDGIAMEYFGGWQVNSQYNAEHGSGSPYRLETHNMKGISVRSYLSGIDYITCGFMCQVPGTNFATLLLGAAPAQYSWNDELRQAHGTKGSCGGGISRVGIAYDEDANQWCIVVSGSYKQTNYQTGTENGSAGGAFGHDTTDPESNMAWWNQFVTSEATEW